MHHTCDPIWTLSPPAVERLLDSKAFALPSSLAIRTSIASEHGQCDAVRRTRVHPKSLEAVNLNHLVQANAPNCEPPVGGQCPERDELHRSKHEVKTLLGAPSLTTRSKKPNF